MNPNLKTFLTAVAILAVSALVSIGHPALADNGNVNDSGLVTNVGQTNSAPQTNNNSQTQPAATGNATAGSGSTNTLSNPPASNPSGSTGSTPANSNSGSTAPATQTPKQPAQSAQDPSQIPLLQIPPGFVLDPGPDPSAKQPAKSAPAPAQNKNQSQSGSQNVGFNFKQLQTVPQQAADTIKNLPSAVISSLAGTSPASGYNYDLNKLSPETTKRLYALGLALAVTGLILTARARSRKTEPVPHQIQFEKQFEIN